MILMAEFIYPGECKVNQIILPMTIQHIFVTRVEGDRAAVGVRLVARLVTDQS